MLAEDVDNLVLRKHDADAPVRCSARAELHNGKFAWDLPAGLLSGGPPATKQKRGPSMPAGACVLCWISSTQHANKVRAAGWCACCALVAVVRASMHVCFSPGSLVTYLPVNPGPFLPTAFAIHTPPTRATGASAPSHLQATGVTKPEKRAVS